MHHRYVQRRLLVPLPNGTAAVVTSILATGAPVLTSILATGTPVLTSILATGPPVLATLHPGRLGRPRRLGRPGRLGLSIWCREHRDWHSHAKRRS
jgi:hypothetical protein